VSRVQEVSADTNAYLRSITISLRAVDSGETVKVNRVVVESGLASNPISLTSLK